MRQRAILVLNAGSSSIKFSLFGLDGQALEAGLRGQIEGIGTAHPQLSVKEADESMLRDLAPEEGGNHQAAIALLAKGVAARATEVDIVAVGHRVVHGGPRYGAPVQLDGEALQALESFIPLAPLHQPHNLAVIRAVSEALPGVPQVGCFDTAFHRGHAPEVELFALPYDLYQEGVRRYGFHGLSYDYIASALPEVAPAIADGRVVVAHLGSGASLCALNNGVSVDSTMGFSALDGLPMGTRTGQLDPGVVLYLLQERGMTARDLEALFYKQSGLLGISGVSNDMRDLLESDEPRAKLAVEYFVFRIAREICALAASLGGLDAVVFTAGIGERSPEIRRRVCQRLAWLGLQLDDAANAHNSPCISAPGARLSAWVVPTNEELMIARHTQQLLGL